MALDWLHKPTCLLSNSRRQDVWNHIWIDLVSMHVIFQQNKDPVHTVKNLQLWFMRQPFILLPWLAQSCDLNPTKHLWKILYMGLYHYKTPPNGLIKVVVPYSRNLPFHCSK